MLDIHPVKHQADAKTLTLSSRGVSVVVRPDWEELYSADYIYLQ